MSCVRQCGGGVLGSLLARVIWRSQPVRGIPGRARQQSERRNELGIFPLFFAAFGLGVERIGILKAVYPAVWGVFQTVTGPLSDRYGRKGLIVAGMWVQAGGLFLTASTRGLGWWLVASALLGVGTAMIYPTLIASVSDASHPSWRARSLSVYRFWRDMGYAIGALAAGLGNPNRDSNVRFEPLAASGTPITAQSFTPASPASTASTSLG